MPGRVCLYGWSCCYGSVRVCSCALGGLLVPSSPVTALFLSRLILLESSACARILFYLLSWTLVLPFSMYVSDCSKHYNISPRPFPPAGLCASMIKGGDDRKMPLPWLLPFNHVILSRQSCYELVQIREIQGQNYT